VTKYLFQDFFFSNKAQVATSKKWLQVCVCSITINFWCLFGFLEIIFRHTQQYFSYMMTVSFHWWKKEPIYSIQCIWEETTDLPQVNWQCEFHIWRNVDIGFFNIHVLWVTLNFPKWSWETSPCLKEHLLWTTSISDKRFRRYELGRTNGQTDTTAAVCSPEKKKSWSIKIREIK
jgi:hypothetical protein